MAVDAWTHFVVFSSGIELYFDVLCLENFLKYKKKRMDEINFIIVYNHRVCMKNLKIKQN